jgi:hypothetical protein
MARLRPTLRAIATIGVWQNQPPFPPAEVVPGAEHRPLGGEHDARRIGGPGLGDRGEQLGQVLPAQRVALGRAHHRDPDDVLVPLDPGRSLAAHVPTPPRPRTAGQLRHDCAHRTGEGKQACRPNH